MTTLRVHVRAKPNRNLQMYFVDPLTGRDVCRSTGTTDWKAAERIAAKWEEEVQAGDISRGITWDEFRSRFKREHLNSLAKNSRKIYSTCFSIFESTMGKPKKVSGVTTSLLSKYKGELVAAGHPSSTIATYIGLLQSALSWGKEIGILKAVPRVKLPTIENGEHMKGRPLLPEEYELFLKCARERSEHHERFCIMLRLSGLRISEAVDLDWQKPPVRVDMTGGKYPRIAFGVGGQKGKRVEFMPLAPDFIAWLEAIPEEERVGQVCPIYSDRGNGNVLAKLTVEDHISQVGAATGIIVAPGKFASAHDLRRTFGSYWAMHVKPAVLQRMMRHKTLDTTMKYYVRLDTDDIGDVLANVPLPRTPKRQKGAKRTASKASKPLRK